MPSKQLRCCQLGSKRFSLKQMQVSIFPSFAKRYKRNKKSLYLPAIFLGIPFFAVQASISILKPKISL